MKPGVNWLVRRCAARLKGIVWVAVLTASASIAAAPRELRVGVYSNEPKVFVDADGKAAGIFVDLLQLVGKYMFSGGGKPGADAADPASDLPPPPHEEPAQ